MNAMRTVEVDLGERRYPVHVGPGALEYGADALSALCPNGRAIIVADKAALDHHRTRLDAMLTRTRLAPAIIELEGGETAKSWAGLQALTDQLLALNIERRECVIAFGGGTIGDLAGFAAAITKRGVGFVQIPTTLLAQVDSSVGGKTGINTAAGKNLAGAFHQPHLVLADTDLLASLPERELRAGYAEIIKAGLIADEMLFERLETAGAAGLRGEALAAAIADAVAFKARIVAEDEREAGRRALLNLGHTFGHAIEAEAKPGALVHGEAVAVGLVLAFDYSVRMGVCPPEDAKRTSALVEAAGLPVRFSDLPGGPYEASALVTRMGSDKKNTGGAITLILARGIGKAYIAPGADVEDLTAFLSEEVSQR